MKPQTLEMQFLPAALEIEETPPPPFARFMLWTVLAFAVSAVAWSYFGHVEIVSVAPGKIVPSGRTKTIQPLERSVVTAIHVSDGQHVAAGEVLVELDPSGPAADRERLSKEQSSLELDRVRLASLLRIAALAGKPVNELQRDPFEVLDRDSDSASIARAPAFPGSKHARRTPTSTSSRAAPSSRSTSAAASSPTW